MYNHKRTGHAFTDAELSEMCNPTLLSDHVKREMNRKPYHTYSGINLMAEYEKKVRERTETKNE